MPGIVRLSTKQLDELIELIEATEAEGCVATELRGLLAEVEKGERRRQPARRAVPPEARSGEITAQERLEGEVGYLFPAGISDEVMTELMEFDKDHSLADLKRMCVDAGLSPNGHKKLLAAKLIAHQ